MINAEFIKDCERVIEHLGDRKIFFEHGNVLIAKVKVDRMTKSGLHIADDYAKREEFKSGFAKILALPSDYGGGPLRVGDYIMFSHEARYPLYLPAIREILGMEVEADLLWTVQDNNVILTIDRAVMEKIEREHPHGTSYRASFLPT